MKAGVVWVNSTNLFDAAAGFGGYRESGFGREGGREGLYEYLVAGVGEGARQSRRRCVAGRLHRRPPRTCTTRDGAPAHRPHRKALHRRQAGAAGFRLQLHRPRRARARSSGRPASATARTSATPSRRRHAAGGWSARQRRTTARRCSTTSPRISPRAPTSSRRASQSMTGASQQGAPRPRSRSRSGACFYYAAHADKYDGQVHSTRSRHVTLAMNEPWGVMGILCPDEAPLLAFVSLVAAGDRHGQPRGRRAVAGRSARRPPTSTRCSTPATCRPAWSTSSPASATCWRRRSPSTTTSPRSGISARRRGAPRSRRPRSATSRRPGSTTAARSDWSDPAEGQGRDYLRHATQVKNIWVPYGE